MAVAAWDVDVGDVVRRKGAPRKATVSIRRLSKRELERGRRLYPAHDVARPRTYGECETQALGAPSNPCPWVSCAWHLYLDVSVETGSITLNFPDREPWQLAETCALRVAARDGVTLEEVGGFVALTRERIRQIEARATARLRATLAAEGTTPADLEPVDARDYAVGGMAARMRRGLPR